MIGLDTTAVIDIFRGDENLKKFLEDNKEPIAATIMSYLEVYFGINQDNPAHLVEAKYYKEFFSSVYNFGLTPEACEESSRIFWRLKKEGKAIEQFDCVIAGILMSNGITKILTRNPRHFERIKQMEVLSY